MENEIIINLEKQVQTLKETLLERDEKINNIQSNIIKYIRSVRYVSRKKVAKILSGDYDATVQS